MKKLLVDLVCIAIICIIIDVIQHITFRGHINSPSFWTMMGLLAIVRVFVWLVPIAHMRIQNNPPESR